MKYIRMAGILLILTLLCAPAVLSQSCDWTGSWSTNYGQMELQQSGITVTGTYTWDQGRIQGSVFGNRLVGTWSEAPSYSPTADAGDFEFTLSDDCNSFSGRWRYGSSGEWRTDWSGTREAPA